MKIFTYIIIAFAIIFIAINLFKIDFKHLLEGESLIAIIGIIAVLCAVILLLIFRISKAIEDKLKNQ